MIGLVRTTLRKDIGKPRRVIRSTMYGSLSLDNCLKAYSSLSA